MNNRFVFVAPMYNASNTLARLLHSLCGQSYDNWKLALIDDMSDESHRERELDILRKFISLDNSLAQKLIVTWNHHGRGKCWEVSNVLHGLTFCDDNDIVCRIDADDWLCDLDALAFINHEYEKTNCDCLWTAHRWAISDKNISGPMPDNADPYRYPWVSSHLKTFRKYLLNDVKDVNYRGSNGEYIRRAGDQAIYLPALYNSKKRIFLPRVTYHYTIDDVPETYQTADAHFQRDEAVELRNRGYVK